MTEVNLAELEAWYLKQLQERFKREHKLLGKIYTKISEEVAQAKNSLKAWRNHTPDSDGENLDEKTKKIMDRFIESVLNSLDELEIPTVHTSISYDACQKFNDGVKKVYMTYNAQGKKTMRRFYKEFKLEIKEIDLHLRKIGNYNQKINKFILKNYQDGKEAEQLIKRIPLLNNNIERLATTKKKLDELEDTFKSMKENLQRKEAELEQLNEDPDLQEFQKIEHELELLKRDFRENLKFSKAFKKMKKSLEKGTITLRDISEYDLKPYLKDPVSEILKEGPKIPHLRQLLIKTRILLEDERDYLQLKSDLKNRIIENINEIVSNNALEDDIRKILELMEKKEKIQNKMKSKGLESQRNDLKEKISIATLDLEHFENDVSRYRRDYSELLKKVKNDREELQNAIKVETDKDIKIKVIIPS
ncbi:MAG: hypothetical protein DRO88_07400 [Promethearchaeia archaeon]|nr:MAG: hypothetical protein DRO88_07400 [Candidatus Lokiarchaeia archaeon]